MRIVIVGATGGLGLQLIEQGLALGHQLTAFVRNPPALTIQHERLAIVRGDLLDVTSVRAALAGHDAVLAAVTPKLRRQTTLYSQGVQHILDGMGAHAVPRLLWITSAGIDPQDAAAEGILFDKVLRPLLFAEMYEDARRSEDVLRRSNLDWIVIRPTRLTNGPHTGVYRVGEEHIPPGGTRISRADVADFMLRQLAGDRYLHKTPVLAY